jgi:hypothetical protein
MTQFTTAESGMFSAGSYDEASRTLTVVFRTTGYTYDISGVSPELGQDFMTQQGKSAIWHQTLKHLAPVKR